MSDLIDPTPGTSTALMDEATGLRSGIDHFRAVIHRDLYKDVSDKLYDFDERLRNEGHLPGETHSFLESTRVGRVGCWDIIVGDPEAYPPRLVSRVYHAIEGLRRLRWDMYYPDYYIYPSATVIWHRRNEGPLDNPEIVSEHTLSKRGVRKVMGVLEIANHLTKNQNSTTDTE